MPNLSKGALKNLMLNIPTLMNNSNQFVNDIEGIKTTQKSFQDELEVLKNQVGALENELNDLKRQNNSIEQALLNDRITIRNVPLHVLENEENIKSCAMKIIQKIDSTIDGSKYEVRGYKAEDNSANFQVRFISSVIKVRFMRKFREMRRQTSLLIDKIIDLPSDHAQSGKILSITNLLTQQNMKLLYDARKFVGKHFDVVFDTPDCILMVKTGGRFQKIETEKDLKRIVEEIEKKSEQK